MSALVRKLGFMLVLLGTTHAFGDDPPKAAAPPKKAPEPARSYRLSGPYTHANLTVFLIHGEDRIKGQTFLTLPEALAQKKAIIHETKNVNQLAIENVSGDEVFVQAGDIVKGGQQDRIITYDLIVPPRSGKMPLAVFCVEAGRWTRRGGEDARTFGFLNSYATQAPTKELKAAVRQSKEQQEVWQNVSKAQAQLGEALGKPVQSRVSPTSLQLALENKDLQKAVEPYVKALGPMTGKEKDVIGYAAVINGAVSSADIYASHALFEKVWPGLLNGSAVEAVAEGRKDKPFKPATADTVKAFLADAEKGKASSQDLTSRVRLVERQGKKALLFETRDQLRQAAPARCSYLAH